MAHSQQELDDLATKLFHALEHTGYVLALAESCTAGLIAATLARVPGISRRLAGSFVVYQIDSKIRWLGIPAGVIQQYGVVSQEVAEAMAAQSLEKSPHANIAASITGHLGPDAPQTLDGLAWIAVSRRGYQTVSTLIQLRSDSGNSPLRCRHERQAEAVYQVFILLRSAIS